MSRGVGPNERYVLLNIAKDVGVAAGDAEITIEAYATSEFFTKTPEQAAAYVDDWAKQSWFRKNSAGRPEIDEGPTITDGKIAGHRGKLWSATGMSKWGKRSLLRKWFFNRGPLLYTITVETRTDLKKEIAIDLEKAIASFRFE